MRRALPPPRNATEQEQAINRLDTWKFAIAFAASMAVLSIACAVAVAISPEATIAFFNSFTHGIDLAKLIPPGGRPVSIGQVIAGALSLAIVGLAAGAMIAGFYNLLVAGTRSHLLTRGREKSL